MLISCRIVIAHTTHKKGNANATTIFRFYSNILHRIHPTALATFAETTGGLALLSNLKKKDKAILISIKMEVTFSADMARCVCFY